MTPEWRNIIVVALAIVLALAIGPRLERLEERLTAWLSRR